MTMSPSMYTQAAAIQIRNTAKAGLKTLFYCAKQKTADQMKDLLRRLGLNEDQMKLVTFQVAGKIGGYDDKGSPA